MKQIVVFGVLVSLLGVLASCAKNENGNTLPALTFRVDSSKVETAVLESSVGFRFMVPKGWQEAPADVRHRLDSAASAVLTEAGIHPQCVHAWQDTARTTLLAASIVMLGDTAQPKRIIHTYAEAAKRNSKAEVHETAFLSGALVVHQLLQLQESWVVFRMLFFRPQQSRALELDWYIPRARYEIVSHLVESVTGSVSYQPHTQEGVAP